MIKKFNEMMSLDLTQYLQKKPTFYKDNSGKLIPTSKDKWLDYIEWSKVLSLLYEHGAEFVGFTSTLSEKKPNTLEICLKIDEQEYLMDYPIIDGNQVIKDPDQMKIHKAELRGFVKAVAFYTGLGLSLWQKDEQIDVSADKTSIDALLKKANTKLELDLLWGTLTEDEQAKYKTKFSQKKESI